jgi:hypothetical protein
MGKICLCFSPAAQVAVKHTIAGWSSQVARQAHNLKVVGSNPAPATNKSLDSIRDRGFFLCRVMRGVNT